MLIKDQWLSKVTGIKCYNVKSINFLSNQQKIKPKTLITYKKIKKNFKKFNPNFIKVGENIIFKKKIKKKTRF